MNFTLRSLRESLALALIALLPFHALLVTVLTKLIAGPGHAPLSYMAAWKEILLAIIVILALVEIIFQSKRWSVVSGKWSVLRIDRIDVIIVFFLVVAFTFLLTTDHYPLTTFLYGFKYDFLPLIAFLILRRVEWSDVWKNSVMKILVIDGVILSLYGLATLVLPMSFFTTLGYSDLHSLYVQNGPLAAFQQLGGSTIRRVQSAMSGPNQFGLWLLIPIAVLLVSVRKISNSKNQIPILLLLIFALIGTFSRAAWLAGIVMAIVAWFLSSTRKNKGRIIGGIFVAIACIGVILTISFPAVFNRVQSNAGHLERPIAAIKTMIDHPFGLGLGSAGPASNATSDTCIDVPVGSDISWAKDRPDLCIFAEGVPVQTTHPCNCPLLTENWYLQWGVEMGWLGFVLSLLLPIFILRKLKMQNAKLKMTDAQFYILHFTFYIFLGLSIAALFLHAFEDSAVAYTVWILLSAVL